MPELTNESGLPLLHARKQVHKQLLRVMLQRDHRWQQAPNQWRYGSPLGSSGRYSMNFLWQGAGTFHCGDQVWKVQAPCMVFRYPGDESVLRLDAGPMRESWLILSTDITRLLFAAEQMDRQRPVILFSEQYAIEQRLVDLALSMQRKQGEAMSEIIARVQLLCAQVWRSESGDRSDDRDVYRIRRAVRQNPDAVWDIQALADLCECKPAALRQRFHRRYACGPCDLVISERMELARVLLQSHLVKQVAPLLGYADYRSFSRQFKNYFGVGPRAFTKSV